MTMANERQFNLEDYQIDVVSLRLVKDRTLTSRTPISSPEAAVDFIGRDLALWDREAIVVLNCDTRNKVNGARVLNMNIASQGTVNFSVTTIRELLKSAVAVNATSILLAHNHPAGDPMPSEEDITLTENLVSICNVMGIELLDHIVVADNGTFNYFSFKEQDMLHPSERVFQIIDDTPKRKRAAVADRKTARKRSR